MDSLIVVLGENLTFDADKVQRDLEKIEGMSNLRRGVSATAALDCEYSRDGSSTIAYLSDDLQRISMRPLNDASLRLALELQKREARPLMVFNQGMDFDFYIEDIKTLEAFKQKVRAAYAEETAAA